MCSISLNLITSLSHTHTHSTAAILFVWIHLASSQQPCMPQQQCTACGDTTIISPFTTVSNVLMSCTVPSDLVLNSSSVAEWEWEKLAADSTIETFLSNDSAVFGKQQKYILSLM